APCVIFFFFFQAEDGIRDLHVTGVQTCALPISPPHACARRAPSAVKGCSISCPASPARPVTTVGARALREPPACRRARPSTATRSEERRVGKEGGAWWL